MIKPSPVRIIAYLNISFAGIYGFSKRVMVGESGDLRLMAPIDAVEVARAHRDTIGGIKVRVGKHASQDPAPSRSISPSSSPRRSACP